MRNLIIKNDENNINSLELVEQINIFRKEEGSRVELRHDTLRNIIKDEFEEEILSQNILEKSISSNGGRPSKVFVLTLNQAKQILMRESKFVRKSMIKYIEELEKKLNQNLNLKDSLLLNIIKSKSETERAVALNKYELEYVKPLEANLEKTTKTLEHKQEVINTLVDEVKLKTQRQFLNEIIRMKGVEYIKDRWSLLYQSYEQNKRVNLSARITGHNLVNKPKIKNKLQYIDEVLNDIPLLYSIAVKLFESDFKNRLKKYYDAL